MRLGLERGRYSDAFKPLTIETAHKWLKKGAKYWIGLSTGYELTGGQIELHPIPVLNLLGMVREFLEKPLIRFMNEREINLDELPTFKKETEPPQLPQGLQHKLFPKKMSGL